MSRVLFVNEQYIRDRYDVSDSLSSKSVITAIYEAQDFYLSAVIGDKFLVELYKEVADGTLTVDNKYLLDNYIQPLVGVQAVEILVRKINYKVGNAGVETVGDKNVSSKPIVDYYGNLVGVALRRLTEYLSRHYAKYHEWLNTVEGIKPHLSASEETSIYLGGTVVWDGMVDPGWRR